jgi:hypothetical protein
MPFFKRSSRGRRPKLDTQVIDEDETIWIKSGLASNPVLPQRHVVQAVEHPGVPEKAQGM